MCFYHASVHIYKPGQIVSIDDFEGDSTHDHAERQASEQEINIRFDELRPETITCSRVKCIYLFDSYENCISYVPKTSSTSFHFYMVKPVSVFGGFPMCLVNFAYKNAGNIELVQKIAAEYWAPSHNWNVKEYLSAQIEIVQECTEKKLSDTNPYMDDQDLAKKWIKQLLNEK